MQDRIFDAANRDAFLECILNNLTTGIFVTDKDYVVQFINEAYANYLGRSREEIIGRRITDFIPDSRAPYVTSTGMPEMGELRTFNHSDGKRIIVVNRLPFKCDNAVLGMLSQTLFGSREDFDAVSRRIEMLDKRISAYARRMKSALSPLYSLNSILGDSNEAVRLRDMIVRYAQTAMPVLVTGATGTGKELAAHSLHSAGPRCEGPFVSINCAAIPKELFESELFGYAPGAFSGAHKDGKVGQIELADRGTLFLDEIGDTPLPVQGKLLRILEERTMYRVGSIKPHTVDFLLVSATNRDLKALIREGLFREDLYYRISPLVLKVPTLHERREDIPLLVAHFLQRMGRENIRITESAMEVLCAYCWPGNIRELRNVIAGAVGICRDNIIDMGVLPPELLSDHGACPPEKAESVQRGDLNAALASSELRLIVLTLQEQGWNISRTARLLGIGRTTLYEKMKKYGISNERNGA